MRFLKYNIPLLACLLFAAPALAEPLPSVNFKGRYGLSFVGIPFGEMAFEASQDASHCELAADIASTGLVDLFAQHRSHTTLSMRGRGFAYPDKTYQTHSQTRKKQRDIRIVTRGGRIVKEEVVPPDNREKRKEVPAELKKGSYDPLGVILEIRRRVAAMVEAGEEDGSFFIDLYDGRRLTRAEVTLHGRMPIRLRGEKTPVVHVSLTRELIAGFTREELARFDPHEPPLNIYFSDDDEFLPVMISIPFTFGQVSATLLRKCDGSDSCLLADR